MKRTLLSRLLLLYQLILVSSVSFSQGWARKYSPDYHMAFHAVYPMNDGSFLCTGNTSFYTNQINKLRIIKVAANGQLLGISDDLAVGNPTSVSAITQDHGLVSMARGPENAQRYITTNVVRTDSNGIEIWRKSFAQYPADASRGSTEYMDIDTTNDGGLIFTAVPYDSLTGTFRLCVVKLTNLGDTVWRKTYFDADTFKWVSTLQNTRDGGYLVTTGITRGTSLYYVSFKIDGTGNMLWQTAPQSVYTLQTTIASDGNILVLKNGIANRSTMIDKMDQAGNILWSRPYPALPDTNRFFTFLIERYDHSLVTIEVPSFNGGQVQTYTMYRLDTLGHILRQIRIPTEYVAGAHSSIGGYRAVQQTMDGGYIIGGRSMLPVSLDIDRPFLIRTDSDGVVYPSVLSGYVYSDTDNDCIKDSSDVAQTTSLITFSSAQDTFTVATDTAGHYAIGLDTVTYSISLQTPSPYLVADVCNPTSVRLPYNADSTISLGIIATAYSPYIAVSGHLGREIPCQRDIFTAEYCNNGTAPFYGSIQFDVDTLLRIDSASVPWLSQAGQQFTFVVDTLQPQQCRTIDLYYTMICDNNLLGRTACIDAYAYQDTIVHVSPLWDQSDLRISVAYSPVTDSITFTLRNKGTGDMSSPKGMIVIEDNVILMTLPQQLPAGAVINKQIKANGSTFRATIPQTDYNPYSRFATAGIEAAGTNAQGGISTGFLTQYPYNGYTSYHYNTCGEIRASYDPNAKSVSPKGAGTDHLVDTGVALEYTIDFQNTGNDTAYLVTITDTLPPYVDPATIRFASSSSPCTMDIHGRELTFTFYPILLPDSGHNELRSHGFVKFYIEQKSGNSLGTSIENKANIYFDYNSPVVTNTATVKVGRLQVTGIETISGSKATAVRAYPNPFNTSTVITVEAKDVNTMELRVYDIAGRQVCSRRQIGSGTFVLDGAAFSPGVYTFVVTGEGQRLGSGQIIAD